MTHDDLLNRVERLQFPGDHSEWGDFENINKAMHTILEMETTGVNHDKAGVPQPCLRRVGGVLDLILLVRTHQIDGELDCRVSQIDGELD